MGEGGKRRKGLVDARAPAEEVGCHSGIERVGAVTRASEGRRVFVIDDDVSLLRAIARVLRDYDVTTFGDVRAAMEALRAGDRPDVILCDLMMPGMSGMELFEALCTTAPELVERVVFMSGGTFTDGSSTFLDAVANERLSKPFENERLRAVIRRFVAREA